MCGIFALFLNRPLGDADVALGRAGTAALRHRGPDGAGEWLDREAGVYLGHRRLAVIDPTPANDQPRVRENLRISFNGEIYNFREIRTVLRQGGARFETEGDIEVLLAAWEAWGSSALDRFDAMFAFALWDGKSAHLATDAFGEKPLFAAETSDGVYVSSEVGVLASLLRVLPDLNGEPLAAYLALGFVPPPATAYPGIVRLAAAAHVVVETGRIKSWRRYWTPPSAERRRGRAQPLDNHELDSLDAALAESIRGRLIADVPLCLFLSSGIDSSLIAAIAARELGVRLPTLTVAFSHGATHNEAAEAGAIAAALGLPHEVVECADATAMDAPQRLLDLFGQPCDELPALAIHQMSRAAAQRYKVALTGMGGDEVFLGYSKHAHFYDHRAAYNLSEPIRLILGRLARAAHHLTGRFAQTAYCVGVRDWERYIAHKCFPAIDWYRNLDAFGTWCRSAFGDSRAPLEYAVPQIELATFMPGGRLVSMDVASMRASLELRTPYLSRRLVETVASFDQRAFLAFGQKSVLRRLAARYLPEQFVRLPKRGFVYPADVYLANETREPRWPSLPDSQIRKAWQRRRHGRGWTRIAVRLSTLSAFALQVPTTSTA